MSDEQVSNAQPRRSWVERFFGVIARLQTWKNMAYLALAFPLGLFYFVFLVVGLALGVGLVIIWVGLPILAVVVLAWWAFASFERLQAEHLLGVRTTGRLAPWEGNESWWQRVKRHLGDAGTWKDLAFLFVKFPLGVASFVVVTVVLAVPAALVGAPLYYRYVEWTTNEVRHYGIDFGMWHIDTLGEALLLVPIGLIVLFAGLHLANVFAKFSGILAVALLHETAATSLPSAPPSSPEMPSGTSAAPPEMPPVPPETSAAQSQPPAAPSDASTVSPRWSGTPWEQSSPSPLPATPLQPQAPEAPSRPSSTAPPQASPSQAAVPQAPQPVPQPPAPAQADGAPEAGH